MVTDKWIAIDLPMLRGAIQIEDESPAGAGMLPGDIADAAGLDLSGDAATKSVLRLVDGGYLRAAIGRNGSGEVFACHVNEVTDKARRATEQWPSEDNYTLLIAVLEQRLRDAPDEQTKGKIRKAIEAVVGLGHDLAVDIGAAYIDRAMPH